MPLPPPATRHESFEQLVGRALNGLPEEVQALLENVAIVIDDEPSEEQLRLSGMAAGEGLYGLYEGTSAVNYGADWVPLPNKITLFRLPLEADFADPDELALEVQKTVVHEIGHHAGIDEERLHRLGF
ncbi:MAG TPA: metallopeptidase family protein [Candidatus Limnocylindria bacterium]|nr:metallopeptidase family protein [Candidatus Limnocylindria bacterium]